jgi:carotenoid cleavage dioxygenase-like enzyme
MLAEVWNAVISCLENALNSSRSRAEFDCRHPYLSGFFQPCSEELSAVPLALAAGTLPAELLGVYVRNGPNPRCVVQRHGRTEVL